MKIKERMAQGIWWIKERPLAQKMAQSRPVGQLRRLGASCERNPFPVQMGLVILYRLALDALYLTVFSETYAYVGFTANLHPLEYLASLAALGIALPLVVKLNEGGTASSLMVTILNYLYFIPFTSYCGCFGADVRFFLVGTLFWILLLVLQYRIPVLSLAPAAPRHTQAAFSVLTVFSVLFIFYISGKYTGFRLTFDIINVYEIRAEAAGYQMSMLAVYALSAMPVVISLLLVYWLRRKNYVIAALLCVTFMFLFSIQARKSTFFFFVLMLLSYFLYRPWMLKWASGLLTGVVCATAVGKVIFHSGYLLALIFQRVMYLPVQLGERYMLFFQENPLNLYREGVMGKLSFSSIYTHTIPRVIGEFNGYPQNNANTGLIGDLFANFPPLLGLLLLPLILVICFRLLDLVTRRSDTPMLVAFAVFFANGFINTSWSIVLLTGGYLLICILLYFFPKKEARL